ncbi:MAG: hypothetical protein WD646_15615 [Actinomycetota bacterium]
MRELIAGDGGSVLVAGAMTPGAVALACEGLAAPTITPSGLPVFPIDALPEETDAEVVRLVACEEKTKSTVRSWSDARGIGVVVEPGHRFARPDGVRVVAVSAASTGSGKTALTRRVARILLRSGVKVVVARHPIANLLLWGRFDTHVVRSPSELTTPRPLEEREEIAPIVGAGVSVVTGLDPQHVAEVAAREVGEGGVVVWDGGGAATPWIETDLDLVAVDLLRLPPADAAERLRSADAIVLTKADSAPADRTHNIESWVRDHNPDPTVILADLSVGVSAGNVLADRRVVLVEDWPSLVLGGLAAGAGSVAARRFRCGVVDPRPFAVGAIAQLLQQHDHIRGVIPSLGRTEEELADLAASVQQTPGDAVLWASNADPAGVIPAERRPIVRAFGELTEVAGPPLQDVLAPLLPGHA